MHQSYLICIIAADYQAENLLMTMPLGEHLESEKFDFKDPLAYKNPQVHLRLVNGILKFIAHNTI